MTGFWKDEKMEDKLCSTYITPLASAFDFVHGHCGIFALALHEQFGYDLHFIADSYVCDDSEDFSLNNLIHIFCMKDDDFIDIRGKTDDEERFTEDFEDFFTEYYILNTSAEDIKKYLTPIMGEWLFQTLLDCCREFIDKHRNFYV